MVTRLSDPERLLSQLKDDKWDLEDLSKRDSWLIIIKAKLKKDPNVWAAVKYGPPTVEALMAADSKLTRTSALAALPALQTQYEDSNKDGYNILVDRISFAKKPALAQKVERDYKYKLQFLYGPKTRLLTALLWALGSHYAPLGGFSENI